MLNLSHFGDNFDFNKYLLGELAHSYGRTGGERLGECAGIYLVQGAEETHVGEEYSCLDYSVDAGAGSGKNGLDIGERLFGLSLDAFGYFAGSGIYGYLA